MSKRVLPRVYSMGSSPLASLITHRIASLPDQPKIPQVVSLLPSEQSLRLFLNNNSTLKLKEYNSNRLYNVSDVQLMSACRPPIYGDGSLAIINELILGINHHDDIKQILEYRKCLTPDSNVLLLNPNKSVLLKLIDKVWNDPNERPNIYQCLNDFIIWKDDKFSINLFNNGNLKISKFPRFLKDLDSYNYDLSKNLSTESDLLKLINISTKLNPVFLNYKDFALQQAEYMIIKTCIGSLSALFNCSNGDLLKIDQLSTLLSKHIDECINIILKSDPLLNKINYTRVVLNKERILDVIITLLKKNKKDSSILRKNVNLYSNKELASTTGYFANLAIRNHIPGNHNVLMNQLIHARTSLNKRNEYENISNIELEL